MLIQAVIGAGWGDEGKGLITDYLAHQSRYQKTLVVRYNGGAQAGHTVHTPEGERHVFSHFGAGTLAGASTYLSEHFICNPILFVQELQQLVGHSLVYVHEDALVTTPYDMLLNQIIAKHNMHGSCGVGIHETQLRHKVLPITVSTLYSATKMMDYLDVLQNMYVPERLKQCGIDPCEHSKIIALRPNNHFIRDCSRFISNIKKVKNIPRYMDTIIFEGAQGLQLSEEYGEMPHLTPSDPGVNNIQRILKNSVYNNSELETYFVTRAYSTRHGAGEFPSIPKQKLKIINDEHENNQTNEFQGSMRYSYIQLGKLFKAIEGEKKKMPTAKHRLAVTCLDQFEKEIPISSTLSFPTFSFLEYLEDYLETPVKLFSNGNTREKVYNNGN